MRLRLTLTVDYIPHGETVGTLRAHMLDVVDHATNNGLLTGETAAEVGEYSVKLETLEV